MNRAELNNPLFRGVDFGKTEPDSPLEFGAAMEETLTGSLPHLGLSEARSTGTGPEPASRRRLLPSPPDRRSTSPSNRIDRRGDARFFGRSNSPVLPGIVDTGFQMVEQGVKQGEWSSNLHIGLPRIQIPGHPRIAHLPMSHRARPSFQRPKASKEFCIRDSREVANESLWVAIMESGPG